MSNSLKTKKLAIDTILFGISTFGSKILVFLLTPLYTAVLLTEEYGVADLINTTVNLIYPVLTLAVADATLRYSLDKNVSKKAVLSNSVITISFSIVLLMALYPIVSSINSELTIQIKKYWGYFIAIYAMYNFHLCFANFIKGIEKTKLYAIQGIIHTGTIIICNIYFLLFLKAGVEGYLLSIIIGLIVPTLLMLFCGKIYKNFFPFKLDKHLFLDMLKYSIPMIPTLLAWSINLYINKYMMIGILPKGEGLSAAGIFSIANKIPSLLTSLMSIFLQAWQLSAIANVKDDDESSYYTNIYNVMHVILLFGCIIIIPFSKIISSVLFDPNYYLAWQHIPFLTLSAFFSCLSGFLASAFRAYKRTGHLFISVAIGAMVNIFLNYILIKVIGVIGAAIATSLSFLITWLVRMITIQNLVALKINVIKTVITYFFIILACGFISFDVPSAYIIYLMIVIAITLINIDDLKNIIALMFHTMKKVLKINFTKEE